jgi:hypothetical protein
MFGKMFAAVALVASTAGVLAPSAALARDRDHGGWQTQDRHSQRGYGNHGYNRRGGHGYNTGNSHYSGNGSRYYNNNGYYPRQHGYQQQHGYDRGYNQHYQSDHDNYRGH